MYTQSSLWRSRNRNVSSHGCRSSTSRVSQVCQERNYGVLVLNLGIEHRFVPLQHLLEAPGAIDDMNELFGPDALSGLRFILRIRCDRSNRPAARRSSTFSTGLKSRRQSFSPPLEPESPLRPSRPIECRIHRAERRARAADCSIRVRDRSESARNSAHHHRPPRDRARPLRESARNHWRS